MSTFAERAKRGAIFLVVLGIMGCSDLIGPESAQYEDECVIYVAKGDPLNVPQEALRRCRPLEIRVVSFGAGVVDSYHFPG